MSSFKSFDDPHEIKRRMDELGIDSFVPDSFPRVESQTSGFPVQLEDPEFLVDQLYKPVRQQADIADLLSDPLGFVHFAFPCCLTPWQAKMLARVRDGLASENE